MANVLFPLTPALSLGEREPRRRLWTNQSVVGSSRCGKRFSLSPRERVGVRGKGPLVRPVWHLAKDRFMERENRYPIWNSPSDSGFSADGRRSSLSPGERASLPAIASAKAGVRGNKMLAGPMREMTPRFKGSKREITFRKILSPA